MAELWLVSGHVEIVEIGSVNLKPTLLQLLLFIFIF